QPAGSIDTTLPAWILLAGTVQRSASASRVAPTAAHAVQLRKRLRDRNDLPRTAGIVTGIARGERPELRPADRLQHPADLGTLQPRRIAGEEIALVDDRDEVQAELLRGRFDAESRIGEVARHGD